MRFCTTTHQHYCSIDLHAKQMHVCILNHDGQIVLHANMKTDPAQLAVTITPRRERVL